MTRKKAVALGAVFRLCFFIGDNYYMDGQAQLALNNYNYYLETGDVPDEVER